jgi:hypothetical protein
MDAQTFSVAIVMFGLTTLAPAAEPAAGGPSTKQTPEAPEWAALFGDASLVTIWQSATAALDKIDEAVVYKELEVIPDWAETIHLASHALQAQVKVQDPDRQADLIDAFRLSARIADDIIAGAEAKDFARTNTAYQRVKLALAIARRSMPKEILNAPPQSVRTAKKNPPAKK